MTRRKSTKTKNEGGKLAAAADEALTPKKNDVRAERSLGPPGTSSSSVDKTDLEMDKEQVALFVNRMNLIWNRGQSMADDAYLQKQLADTKGMQARLRARIKEREEKRAYLEKLLGKMTQVQDARAALEEMREEERKRKAEEAEEEERQREKKRLERIEAMEKKKQEILQSQQQKRVQQQQQMLLLRQQQQQPNALLLGSPSAQQLPPPAPTDSPPQADGDL